MWQKPERKSPEEAEAVRSFRKGTTRRREDLQTPERVAREAKAHPNRKKRTESEEDRRQKRESICRRAPIEADAERKRTIRKAEKRKTDRSRKGVVAERDLKNRTPRTYPFYS